MVVSWLRIVAEVKTEGLSSENMLFREFEAREEVSFWRFYGNPRELTRLEDPWPSLFFKVRSSPNTRRRSS